jgi:hypothetical protein
MEEIPVNFRLLENPCFYEVNINATTLFGKKRCLVREN